MAAHSSVTAGDRDDCAKTQDTHNAHFLPGNQTMNDIITTIFGLFSRFGYGAIFAGVMLDNAGFPVPGELVLLITGSMVASGEFSYLPAVCVAAFGALLSDSLWYLAGRAGSKRLLGLYCKLSFGSTACLARTEFNLSRFGARSLIYARFVPGYRTFAAPMAGMAGVPYRQFALYDGIGALLWAALGVWIGHQFAAQFNQVAVHLESVRTIVIYLVGAGLLLFFLIKLLVRRRHGRAVIEVKTQEDEVQA
jgi:membrane protein DedA with SNARE-associated domain